VGAGSPRLRTCSRPSLAFRACSPDLFPSAAFGSTEGFLRIGFVSIAGLVLGSLIGTATGALLGHQFRDGKGGFWSALGATLVGAVGVVIVSKLASAIALPALLLLPMAAATALELATRSG
jgi:hypothetical protein